MNIHEYQGKELFKQYGIPVQDQVVIDKPEDAAAATRTLGGFVVIKAQVLVGGRGKAGGVKLAKSPEEAVEKAKDILGLTIKGIPVKQVLVTAAADILKEYYMSITVDRTGKGLLLMVSKAGGVDIEELAVEKPEEILRMPIQPRQGIDEAELSKIMTEIFEKPALVAQATQTVHNLYKLFMEKDCSLVEINPYAQVGEEELMALDAKVNFDDNAVMRHDDVQKLQNREEHSEDEWAARDSGLSFVSMDGDIGCIVNGAGLAMATMDIIKLYGGNPANFLDVGGSSNPEKVLNALKIIVGNPKVKAILINIFGGITRCDDIANGILMAMDKIDITLPMVIRLIGTNDKEGREILNNAGFEVAEELSGAVEKVVALGK
jgi:succinyl-CoA synthetase beta subunit